ncbi:MAG: ATP-binding protein [Leptolyngbya sp. Prado105]|jgi:PAS domain S-box-containing protein|nr:ATP-binding protein [Leptolyngbya sp. Prado105]
MKDQQHIEQELQSQAVRSHFVSEIALKIRQSLKIQDILKTTVVEIKELLEADRVLIYQIDQNGIGQTVQEAVTEGYILTAGRQLVDQCFQDEYVEKYRQGSMSAIEDINTASIHPCHAEFLRQFQVQANLVVPILLNQWQSQAIQPEVQLWGLLIAHQCDRPRCWSEVEVDLMRQIANQFSIAITQSQLVETLSAQNEALELRVQQRTRRLSESEARFRGAFEHAVSGMAIVNLDGRFLKVNAALRQILGYPEVELLQKTLEAITDFEDWKAANRFLKDLRNNFETGGQFEQRYLHRKGYLVSVVCGLSIVRDNQDMPLYYVLQVQDVTEQRAIEQTKREFVSIVSHELRTPLASIRGSLGLLASGVLSDDPVMTQKMLDISCDQTERLVRLVNDVLDFERLDAHRVLLDRKWHDSSDLIQQAFLSVRSFAEAQQIALSYQPSSIRIWADGDRVIQVLINLISNAIKFSSQNSEVTIGVKEEETCVAIAVSDRGRGIPADQLESIFAPFQQVDASDSRDKDGTGLGLAICRAIVQQHEGCIWVESTLRVGSTFVFTLPKPS